MKIQSKLFLILFGFSLLLVTGLVLLMQWSIGQGMVEYVNRKEVETLKPLVIDLAKEYKKENSWLKMQGQHRKFDELIFSKLKGSEFIRPHPAPFPLHNPSNNIPDAPFQERQDKQWAPPQIDGRHLSPRHQANYALLDNNKNIIAGYYSEDLEYTTSAIMVGQAIVGFFAVSKRNELAKGYESDFIEQQRSYLWIIALVTMVLVALATLPLARHLVEPIKLITGGMRKLTQGHYQHNIDLQRQDELGELSRDFNELALTLYKNEGARKRWLANISHELRTPVTIFRGELEAMLDDVRPLTKKNIASANDEVKHLQDLIDDLHQLTSADIGAMHYRKKKEDLTLLLNAEVDKYSGYLLNAGIKLDVEIEIGVAQAVIFADKTRLWQLFENIINNAVKYTGASVLKITLDVDETGTKPLVVIKFEDNGVGVAEQHLAHLFEYLYRVENSRNRKTGGAGLGLSICAHIVAAHQGEIFAEQSSLGGLAIVIKLPLSK